MNDIDLYWAAQRIKLEAVFIFGFQAQDLLGRLVSHELAMSLLTRTVIELPTGKLCGLLEGNRATRAILQRFFDSSLP